MRTVHSQLYLGANPRDVFADIARLHLQPRFKICPTDTIDAVVDRQLVSMRWGLIPAWWGKPLKEFKLATFNARAETVAEKSMFSSAFKNSRCLIPASGYYEWQTTLEGEQPFYFTRRDGHKPHCNGPWRGLLRSTNVLEF